MMMLLIICFVTFIHHMYIFFGKICSYSFPVFFIQFYKFYLCFGCVGSSLLSASGFGVWGLLSLAAAHELFIEVASLASVAVVHGLSFPVACGILLDWTKH